MSANPPFRILRELRRPAALERASVPSKSGAVMGRATAVGALAPAPQSSGKGRRLQSCAGVRALEAGQQTLPNARLRKIAAIGAGDCGAERGPRTTSGGEPLAHFGTLMGIRRPQRIP
jgi:hypothetical protein